MTPADVLVAPSQEDNCWIRCWAAANACSAEFCEGDGDVTGVVTPLRGVAQVVLHGVQVVEVGVLLRVHQDRGVEEDGEGQVEVEMEEGEVRENRTCMTME